MRRINSERRVRDSPTVSRAIIDQAGLIESWHARRHSAICEAFSMRRVLGRRRTQCRPFCITPQRNCRHTLKAHSLTQNLGAMTEFGSADALCISIAAGTVKRRKNW